MVTQIQRGDVFFVELPNERGSVLGGYRPVVVVSHDLANRFSAYVSVAPITEQLSQQTLPTQVKFDAELGFDVDSIVQIGQIQTVDKQFFKEKVTTLSHERMKLIDDALLKHFGINTIE